MEKEERYQSRRKGYKPFSDISRGSRSRKGFLAPCTVLLEAVLQTRDKGRPVLRFRQCERQLRLFTLASTSRTQPRENIQAREESHGGERTIPFRSPRIVVSETVPPSRHPLPSWLISFHRLSTVAIHFLYSVLLLFPPASFQSFSLEISSPVGFLRVIRSLHGGRG